MQLAIVIIVIFDVLVVFGIWYLWGRVIKLQDAIDAQIKFNQTVCEIIEERSPIDLTARLKRIENEWTEHAERHSFVADRALSGIDDRIALIEAELSSQSARIAKAYHAK